MFLNYPRWQSAHDFDVVEVVNGARQPFPNAEWNGWSLGKSGTNRWVCVQAVWIDPWDDADDLWVVDPAAPEMKKIAGDGAKLVRINLANNQVTHIYNLTDVVGENSYINDVRVDLRSQTAYLTESKIGGLVVVNLISGKGRTVLTKTKPVKSAPPNTK